MGARFVPHHAYFRMAEEVPGVGGYHGVVLDQADQLRIRLDDGDLTGFIMQPEAGADTAVQVHQ